ncbi:MAG TPA: biotin-dependent carboxyltransferase family protein [Chthoniobacterales bacterium]|jgi:antagonist of KipI
MGGVSFLRAGPLTTVQDLGRPGYRALGVSLGGALDSFAAQVANLLVGNSVDAAVIEIVIGGVRLSFDDQCALAWIGGDFPVQLAGAAVAPGRRVFVRQPAILEIGLTRGGARMWLALSGGFDLPVVLGSRSTDLRSSFGGYKGRALRDGDRLSLGQSAFDTRSDRSTNWAAPADWAQTATERSILRVVRGPEWDEFCGAAQEAFLQTSFTVSSQTDRMGTRLTGTELQRTQGHELPSEPVAAGTVQVARDGQPIILLGDCQTIGGYPKIAHVITVDLGRAAQLQPEDRVIFAEVSQEEATRLFAAREKELRFFRTALQLRMS